MPSIQYGNRIVDGIGFAMPIHKSEYDTLSQGVFCVIDADKNAQQALAVAITDEPSMYFVKAFDLPKGSTYNISGQCSPAGSTVYLSSKYVENSVASLNDNIELSVISDDDGQFMFNTIDGGDDTIAVWIHVGPEYAQTAGIACDYVSTDIDATNRYLLYAPFNTTDQARCTKCGGDGRTTDSCNTCDGSGRLSDGTICPTCGCVQCSATGRITIANPRYRVNGSTSLGIDMVYLSFCESGAVLDVETLTNNLLESVATTNAYECTNCGGDKTLENGETCTECDENGYMTRDDLLMYTIESDVINNMSHVVWCLTDKPPTNTSDSPYIDVWGASLTNGEVVCLSGDTMILMADGSVRRLDELVEGDVVMSEDLTPTRVKTLARGHFNSYHTLYRFEDETVIDETHAHRFYNDEQGFWQRLGNWRIGEHAISQNGSRIALVSIERIAEPAEMFGIWTESGTYYANGLLSGDASCNRHLLADATAEQTVDMMLSMEESKLLSLIGLGELLP